MKLPKIFSQQKTLPSLPKYKGYVDSSIGPVVRGWAIDTASSSPVTVRVTCGSEVQYVEASDYREDLLAVGQHPTGFCGYKVEFSEYNVDVATVEIIEKIKTLPASKMSFKNHQWFLLHLPRSAGSSFTRVMDKVLGDKNTENTIETKQDNLDAYIENQFVSGCVGYDFFVENFSAHNFVSLVFLRDPIKQLISHINWVRHLDDIKETDFAKNHPESVLKLASKLNAINFNDLKSVATHFSNLTPLETSLFNNMQTRYLADMYKGPIQYQDYVKAKQNLSKIHFVGITEAFEKSVMKFSEHAGMDLSEHVSTQVNVNRYKDGLSPENNELALFLKPLIEYDQLIYDYGKTIFERT